jgi:hypothetical protein
VPAVVANFQNRKWRYFTLPLAILLLVLNLQLYGGNLLRYKKIAPEMSAVLSPEIALQNRISARDTIFTLLKEQRISYDQAVGMTSLIDHPGDRADAIYLAKNYVQYMSNGPGLMSPLSYIIPWGQQMLSGVFGIAGHLSMNSIWPTNLSIVVLMALTTLAILIRWRPRKEELLPSLLGIVAGFYGVFLMYAVNYRIYIYFASFPLALQGRYIFPIIGPLYVLTCYYLLRLFNGKHARLCLTAAAAFVFIASDFPFFLTHVTPDWFSMAHK